MTDQTGIIRSLKIKTGVVNRLIKETHSYNAEVVSTKLQLDTIVANGQSDSWEGRNAQKLWEESKKMVEDTSQRLGKAVAELRALVTSAKGVLTNESELQPAEEALELASV